ncbi:hypothetical protein MIND_00198500 [Mycena indigotica]|uniref:CCHC-type domain-containing protein n=1 Tax=Mycena indigotica TaxID=2126181 RepID=A0A8H6T8G3_9AGAR|nr:uncharacterized protein MIND_00198500 [Mycena indigotica]KAF7311877.1 hypothetical protein MIND_00198500 [Mycena indigotica]
MPARRDRIAPVFDSAHPRDLPKFFSDLEFLLARASVIDDQQKKHHATRYLELNDQELWEFLPEFANPGSSYAEFVDAVFALYPEANPDRRFAIADLEALVSAFASIDTPSRATFCAFYRDFWRVSSFLRSKRRLADFEQSQALVRAIPPALRPAVGHELELRCPDVQIDDAYPLDAVRAAIDRVLLRNKASSSLAAKEESVSPKIEKMPHTNVPRSANDPSASRLDSPPSPQRFRSSCSYCSDPAHWIRDCPRLTFDLASGFCKRNAEGKVVLPNGRFVPHTVVGPDLRSRIELCRPSVPPPFAAPVVVPAQRPPRVEPTSRPVALPSVLIPLTEAQRIEQIEFELAVLHGRRTQLQPVHSIDMPPPSSPLSLPNQRQRIERSFLIPPQVSQESSAPSSRL